MDGKQKISLQGPGSFVRAGYWWKGAHAPDGSPSSTPWLSLPNLSGGYPRVVFRHDAGSGNAPLSTVLKQGES